MALSFMYIHRLQFLYSLYYMKTRRNLFTDGWNSFWHLFFGVLAIGMPPLMPNFIIYQLIYYRDVNLFVDLGEFFIGFVALLFIFIYI